MAMSLLCSVKFFQKMKFQFKQMSSLYIYELKIVTLRLIYKSIIAEIFVCNVRGWLCFIAASFVGNHVNSYDCICSRRIFSEIRWRGRIFVCLSLSTIAS